MIPANENPNAKPGRTIFSDMPQSLARVVLHVVFSTKNRVPFLKDLELRARLHAYMEAFGLNFGCFDFAVTKSGEPVFFECNPNGQWQWVENLTGLPIGKAIAEELLN